MLVLAFVSVELIDYGCRSRCVAAMTVIIFLIKVSSAFFPFVYSQLLAVLKSVFSVDG